MLRTPGRSIPIHPAPVKVIPLGGLGEIGMNCLALEQDGARLVIDCGLTFDDRGLGVDTIHADFSWLEEAPERLSGIIVTHGHEDHVGAVAHLLDVCPAPVYGPPYALAILRERLAQRAPLPVTPELIAVAPGDRLSVGPFEVEPYRVTHSMLDCTGVIVRTAQGVVVHSGDFKIDAEPLDGEPLDLTRLARLRDEEGVRLLLSDSTNSFSEGTTGREATAAARLEEIVRSCEQRVVVTLFASNGHRLRSLSKIAKRTGRKLCLLGRSLQMHARIAESGGYLPELAEVRVHREMASRLPRHELLVLATGTQGELPAAFARLAREQHPDLTLEAGDCVIHSARIIPGCETRVYPIFNQLARRDIDVIWQRLDPDVHVSGHAHRGEQRTLIETLRPKSFIPLHGTLIHLREHAALARDCGVADVMTIENGAVVSVTKGPLERVGDVEVGRVHREHGTVIGPRVIRDRALMAELGLAIVTVLVDDEGRPVAPLDLLTRGVLHEDENQDFLDRACDSIHEALMRARYTADRPDEEDIERVAKRALKRFFARHFHKKPLCYAMVTRQP